MNGTIAEVMQRQVKSVSMDDSVAQVERAFAEKGLTWAVVVEGETGGAVVGVISASDLLRFNAQGRDAATVRAWQLCSYKPISVDQATPVREVARMMADRRIHHVVVNDRDGIAGVLSSLDIVRLFADEA